MRDSSSESIYFDDQIMVGCDLKPNIKSYGDADTMCPKRGVDTQV